MFQLWINLAPWLFSPLVLKQAWKLLFCGFCDWMLNFNKLMVAAVAQWQSTRLNIRWLWVWIPQGAVISLFPIFLVCSWTTPSQRCTTFFEWIFYIFIVFNMKVQRTWLGRITSPRRGCTCRSGRTCRSTGGRSGRPWRCRRRTPHSGTRDEGDGSCRCRQPEIRQEVMKLERLHLMWCRHCPGLQVWDLNPTGSFSTQTRKVGNGEPESNSNVF